MWAFFGGVWGWVLEFWGFIIKGIWDWHGHRDEGDCYIFMGCKLSWYFLAKDASVP